MKVVHIFNELKFSGAEKMYVEAAHIFQENECDLIAIGTGKYIGEYAPYFLKAGYRVLHFPLPDLFKNPLSFVRYFIKFNLFLKQEKPDILHIHKNGKFWWFALCARFNRITSIRTIHNIFINRKKLFWVKYWFERWSAKFFFRLIFQSIGESVQQNELRYYNKTVKIYNWYSKSFYPASISEKESIRNKLKIGLDKFVIITIGGCSNVKDHHQIINSLTLISNKIDYLFIHIGTGITENEEIALAEKLGLLNNIRFCGNITNVRDYLVASDVFIMPSKYEGLSIASIEAQACGIPSIVYNNPGIRDVIIDDYNGFLIKSDYHLIAKKITFLFENKLIAKEMGNNAIYFSKENFSMEKNANKVYYLYLEGLKSFY